MIHTSLQKLVVRQRYVTWRQDNIAQIFYHHFKWRHRDVSTMRHVILRRKTGASCCPVCATFQRKLGLVQRKLAPTSHSKCIYNSDSAVYTIWLHLSSFIFSAIHHLLWHWAIFWDVLQFHRSCRDDSRTPWRRHDVGTVHDAVSVRFLFLVS